MNRFPYCPYCKQDWSDFNLAEFVREKHTELTKIAEENRLRIWPDAGGWITEEGLTLFVPQDGKTLANRRSCGNEICKWRKIGGKVQYSLFALAHYMVKEEMSN